MSAGGQDDLADRQEVLREIERLVVLRAAAERRHQRLVGTDPGERQRRAVAAQIVHDLDLQGSDPSRRKLRSVPLDEKEQRVVFRLVAEPRILERGQKRFV